MGTDRSLSRRAFLSGIAASSAAAILAACGSSGKTPTAGGAQPTTVGASPAKTGGTPTTAPNIANSQAAASGNLPTPRNQTMVSEVNKMQVFDSFNPYIPNGEQNCGTIQACRETLFYFNSQQGKLIPWLATKYEYSPDFAQLTLSLDPKAKWSDGQPFTADDVMFTLQMLKDNTNFSGSSIVTTFLDSWSAPNPNTVVIKQKQPNPRVHYYFTSAVSQSQIKIAPKHIWEKQDPGTFKNNPPVYTGPYLLDRVIPQQFIYVWKKNPDYWNKAVMDPKPQYLVWRQTLPADATVEDFKRGNIDAVLGGSGYVFDFPLQESVRTGGYKNMIQVQFLDPWPRAIYFNQESPSGLFQTAEGRQAMSYLLDRDQIAKTIWQPSSNAAKYPWAKYKSNDRWENADIQKQYDLTYDQKKAEQLLDGLGATKQGDTRQLNGKPLALTIITQVAVGLPEYQIAQTLATNAKKVGITVDVKSIPGTAYTDANQLGQWDMRSEWMSADTGLDPNQLYSQYEDRYYKPLGERSTQGQNTRSKLPDLNTIAMKLDLTSPDDANAKPLFDQGLAAFMKNQPSTPSIQTIYPLAYNTTYWTGWPTPDNLYNVPAQWWQNFLFVIGKLEPTGK